MYIIIKNRAARRTWNITVGGTPPFSFTKSINRKYRGYLIASNVHHRSPQQWYILRLEVTAVHESCLDDRDPASNRDHYCAVGVSPLQQWTTRGRRHFHCVVIVVWDLASAAHQLQQWVMRRSR